jgi:membrane protein DedA with SNARE-associated domain
LDTELIWALVIAFGTFAAAGLGVPIPEEVAIIAAGIWTASEAAARHGVYRFLMFPACVAGVVMADIFLYSAGRFFGARVLRNRWVHRLVPPETLERTERNFHNYGIGILLFGRLLPGIRLPLFLAAGMMRLSVPRFLLADGLGAVLGNGLLFFLAFWFGDSFRDLLTSAEHEVKRAQPILILIGVLLALGYLFYRFVRKPVHTGDPKEVPIIGPQIASHLIGPRVEPPSDTVPERPPGSEGLEAPVVPAQAQTPEQTRPG